MDGSFAVLQWLSLAVHSLDVLFAAVGTDGSKLMINGASNFKERPRGEWNSPLKKSDCMMISIDMLLSQYLIGTRPAPPFCWWRDISLHRMNRSVRLLPCCWSCFMDGLRQHQQKRCVSCVFLVVIICLKKQDIYFSRSYPGPCLFGPVSQNVTMCFIPLAYVYCFQMFLSLSITLG